MLCSESSRPVLCVEMAVYGMVVQLATQVQLDLDLNPWSPSSCVIVNVAFNFSDP